MERRDFFKAMAMTPFFTPLLLSSKQTADDAEIFMISDDPQLYLPPLLKELRSLGIVDGKTFTICNDHPQSEPLSQELCRQEWKKVAEGITAHLSLSSSRLRTDVRPSFTLAREGRVWDTRIRKLHSLWKELGLSRHSSLLTTVSVRNQPSSLARGETAVLLINGRRILELSLHSDCTRSYRTKRGRITVKVEKGKARVAESSCRHKICVHCPPVSHPGERIICAPNRFVLEIDGLGTVDTIIG